jgi:hypothetical protein
MTHAADSQGPLRRALLLDATASGAMALLALAAAGPLSAPLGLSAGLLRGAGMVLVPFVALLLVAARAPRISPALAWTVIAVNGAWIAASVLLVVERLAAPTALGTAFVLAQAAAVALFTVLEYAGVRGARRLASA